MNKTFARFFGGLAAASIPALALGLAACGSFGEPVNLRAVDAPRVSYDSVIAFTAGALAAHPARSTGGPVIAWAISPALPSGLSLSASGAISGLASTLDTGRRYVVTAKGPGGNDTASFILRVLEESIDPSIARPRLAYVSPAHDTVGKAVSRAPASTGGPITGYAVSPALPPGLALDPGTGAITGTPAVAFGSEDYAVIAFGPGGRDTATLSLAVHAPSRAVDPRLSVRLRFHGAEAASPSLPKRAAGPGNLLPSVTLKRMILVVSSTVGDTLRDTVTAGSQGLPVAIDTTRAFLKEYALPQDGRTWRYSVRVLDARDSVIFSGAGDSIPVAGLARDTLDLFARFVGFRSAYAFPDSVSLVNGGKKWPLAIRRFVLEVDSARVLDTASSATAGFKGLFIEYPYLPAGRSYSIRQVASGSVDARADTVLFEGSGAYTPTPAASSIPLFYVGPTDLD